MGEISTKQSFIIYYNYMDMSKRTDKLLSIIDRLLGIIEYEQFCESLDEEEVIEDDNDEEDEEFDDYKDCRSHINEDWLPENNLVKCIWVDKDWNGIYKFK